MEHHDLDPDHTWAAQNRTLEFDCVLSDCNRVNQAQLE